MGNLSTMSDWISPLRMRARVGYARLPRKVLAFYYGWYGNPTHSGRWLHWEGVDAERRQIATSTHYPTLGAYDSNDPAVLDQHCRWAKQAGIDGFIYSWWGKDRYEEKPLPLLLETAQRHRLEVCIYYEFVPKPGDPNSVVAEWLDLCERFGKHPAYLKVEGKPVIFVYGRAMEQLSLPQWAQVLVEVERQYKPGVCAIADRLSRATCRVFDGVHTYITVGALQGIPLQQVRSAVERTFEEPLRFAGEFHRIACATVIPGYDDTKIRTPGAKVERFNGDSYRHQWEAVLNLNPDWVLITSFNEWHEGSEIEPSVEHGDRYLRLTAEFAPRFRALSERPRMAPPLTALTGEKMADLRKRWQGKRIGILPDASSEALWWLLDSDLPLDALSWEQVVEAGFLKPSRYQALVYAGGEYAPATVREAGDVERALRAYLQAGGALLALPSEPFPFYYADRKPVGNTLARFGLPIAGSSDRPVAGETGFERPPVSNLQFHFNRSEMPEIGTEPVPFPAGGDLRWRPLIRNFFLSPAREYPKHSPREKNFVRAWVQTEADYIPLATLRDAQGRSWGEGAGILRYHSGAFKGATLGYIWFRLLEMQNAPILLYHMVRLVRTFV